MTLICCISCGPSPDKVETICAARLLSCSIAVLQLGISSSCARNRSALRPRVGNGSARLAVEISVSVVSHVTARTLVSVVLFTHKIAHSSRHTVGARAHVVCAALSLRAREGDTRHRIRVVDDVFRIRGANCRRVCASSMADIRASSCQFTAATPRLERRTNHRARGRWVAIRTISSFSRERAARARAASVGRGTGRRVTGVRDATLAVVRVHETCAAYGAAVAGGCAGDRFRIRHSVASGAR